MNKSGGSNVWPYVIVGSAIGGAVGYLLMTDNGRKFRRAVANPEDLANNLEDARSFIERKARIVTDKVHGVIDKAKRGIDEGERAYREAEQDYQSRLMGRIEGKQSEIASGVHKTVDNVSRTAVTIEQSVIDPICEMGALYKGVERGIRAMIGKDKDNVRTISGQGMSGQGNLSNEGPVPVQRDRAMNEY